MLIPVEGWLSQGRLNYSSLTDDPKQYLACVGCLGWETVLSSPPTGNQSLFCIRYPDAKDLSSSPGKTKGFWFFYSFLSEPCFSLSYRPILLITQGKAYSADREKYLPFNQGQMTLASNSPWEITVFTWAPGWECFPSLPMALQAFVSSGRKSGEVDQVSPHRQERGLSQVSCQLPIFVRAQRRLVEKSLWVSADSLLSGAPRDPELVLVAYVWSCIIHQHSSCCLFPYLLVW